MSTPAAQLVDGPIDVAAVIARVQRDARCGAVVLFLGCVRDQDPGEADDARVARLDYDAYRPMASAALARIVDEIDDPDQPLRAAVVHRLGPVEAGEPSVAIAVASPRRDAAYAASRTLLERLKREVPIWKREVRIDGAVRWREEEPLEGAESG
ncbi:MAG: molybdenum cofactor biosynthesis protein MoaE [Acidobacteriota bacterium]